MSLRYIIGDSGTGKTTLCINEIIKKDNSDNFLLYIVPEQFSMESEKALLKYKKEGCIIGTGVYSFRHLAFNIMNKLGISDRNILNDVGKSMLLKKSLIDIGDNLELYKNVINQKGFTDSLGSTISELMQYNITSENLLTAANNIGESNLKYKLTDIEKILSYYSHKLKGKYISSENTLDILSNLISEVDFIKDSEIWIDGFKSFTPQEYNVICELLKYSKRVNIAFTLNSNKFDFDNIDKSDAYFVTKSAISKLTKLARNNNVPVENPTILSIDYRHNNIELQKLCSEFLGYNENICSNKCEHIKIYNANNKYAEIDFVCSEIIHLIRDKKFRYDEIAVIIGSTDYEKPLCNALNNYNIPNFVDTRRSIISHPLTQTITSLLEIVSTNWSIDSIFSLLKTFYIPMEKKDIYLLENYVQAQNIKGIKKWNSSEWEYGFDSKTYTKTLIEDIRDIFVDYVSVFTNKIKRGKKYKLNDISTALFDFLQEIDAKKTLNKAIEKATKENDLSMAMINKQIWGLICDVFDKMSEFLGSEIMTISQYIKVLQSGLETASIGLIPILSDHLIVGDIERTRLPDIKILFILGVNEGVLPPQREEVGILTDLERVTLRNNFFELAPDLSAKLSQDKLNIYMAISKPSDYLYLSYSKGKYNGETLSKSSVITRIQDMFTDIEDISWNVDNDYITAPLPVFDKLINKIKSCDEIPKLYKDLYSFYSNSKEYIRRIESINNILNMASGDYLSLDMAKNLYTDSIDISVSKLESFSKCPYSFFLTYGLNAYGKEIYQFEYLESGNIYHAALEHIFNTINDNKLELRELEKDKISELAENAIDAAILQTRKQSLINVPRYKGYINRMKRTMTSIVWGFSNRAKSDKFKPKEFELSFGSNNGIKPITYSLNEGKTLNLTGKIDRIDHLEDKDKIYIKIIDYKQSEHKIDFNNIYNGIDIQLPLYLNTYINTLSKICDKEPEAGGILYYNIHNPQLNKEEKDDNKALMASMRYRGIISDEKIVANNIKPQVISPIIFNKAAFKNLGKFIDKKIIECGNEIAKGKISIKPYRYVNGSSIQTGCDYCNFKAICMSDLKDNSDKYNTFKKDKNIIDKIINNQ